MVGIGVGVATATLTRCDFGCIVRAEVMTIGGAVAVGVNVWYSATAYTWVRFLYRGIVGAAILIIGCAIVVPV